MVVVVRKNQNHLATLPNEMESMNERSGFEKFIISLNIRANMGYILLIKLNWNI